MKLEPDERIALAYRLWDSVADDDDVELTPELVQELKRRMVEHEREPGSAVPWEEVRERLRAKYG